MTIRPESLFPKRKPLPRGRGFPAATAGSLLSAARASAPAIFALLVGLAVVLRPGQITEQASPAIQPPSARFDARVVTPAREPPPSEAGNKREPEFDDIAASAPIGHQAIAGLTEKEPIDWLGLLYPELVRMTELEREPVSAALFELVPMFDSEDPAVRLAVVEALGDMSTDAILPTLLMALSDPEADIRLAALEALAAHDEDSAIGSIEALLYDADREVRRAAIEALADLDNEIAVHSLAGLIGDPDDKIRFDAVSALADIGGESAGLYLLQARYDPDPRIRRYVESAIRELN